MIKFENECVDCGLPCLGSSCPNRNVRHLYCDRCKVDVPKLYVYDNEQLCWDCVEEEVLSNVITEVIE